MKLLVVNVDGFCHLNIVRNRSIFVVCRCLSSVLEKLPSTPTSWKFSPKKNFPQQNYCLWITTRQNYFVSFVYFFFYFIVFFVQNLKLISLNIFLFLIEFFYGCLYLYPIIFSFQLHVAKWPTILDHWTE